MSQKPRGKQRKKAPSQNALIGQYHLANEGLSYQRNQIELREHRKHKQLQRKFQKSTAWRQYIR